VVDDVGAIALHKPIHHSSEFLLHSESSNQNTTEDEICELSIDSGISLVKHYDATRCSEQPDLVVQEFLEILSQA
jgi:hypothetical protein